MSEQEPTSNHSHHWKFNQTRAALLVELLLVGLAVLFAYTFWNIWCPDGIEVCVGKGGIAPAHYLFLSILRPFVLTPHAFGAYLAAKNFSEFDAIALSAIASVLSSIPVYYIFHFVGKNLVNPWMAHNLPRTLRLIKSQDYKFIFAARLIPIFPFDLVSALAGIFTLNIRRFLIFTFLGILPECIFLTLMSSPKVSILGWTVNAVGLIACLILIPFIGMEWHSRKRGRSLYMTLRAAYNEILEEARSTNEIIKRNKIDPTKTPVLLIYGFFSSRRALHLLEKQLVNAGFDVLSFNLGGMFGTFFTQGVAETAEFIDYKIKRQMDRHGFKKIHIVAHSKGTLVAYWWLLKLGGSKYCDKAVLMASPCAGSYYTYLALITPLAFFWRDMWQMRPGSSFLKLLHQSEIPNHLKVWSLYSDHDYLARGSKGIFKPQKGAENMTVIGMHEYSHFDFILKRGPIKEVVKILTDDASERDLNLDQESSTSLSQLLGEDLENNSNTKNAAG